MESTRIVKGHKLPTAAMVAEWGWGEAEKGRPFSVYSSKWKAFAFGTRLMPRTTAARFAAKTNEQI